MPKKKFDTKRDARFETDLDAGLKSGTTNRRMRYFSREICFALALTLAAVASVFVAVQHENAKTATAAASAAASPTAHTPVNTQ